MSHCDQPAAAMLPELFFEDLINPLEPFDVFALNLMPYPFAPRGAHLLPPNPDGAVLDYVHAYRCAIREMMPILEPHLRRLKVIGDEPVGEALFFDLYVRFEAWHGKTAAEVGRPLYHETPRQKAIFATISFLRGLNVLPNIAPGNHAAAVRRYAVKLKRVAELEAAGFENGMPNEFDVLAAIWNSGDFKASRLRRDENGRASLEPHIPSVFDVMVRGCRSAHRPTKVFELREYAAAGTTADDPSSIAELADLARTVRAFAHSRGPAAEAAIEHMMHSTSMGELTAHFRVSESSIRRRVEEIRRRFKRVS